MLVKSAARLAEVLLSPTAQPFNPVLTIRLCRSSRGKHFSPSANTS
ncbi:MAG: hypothetical protein ABUL62_19940 [Myxococcales bacterium]